MKVTLRGAQLSEKPNFNSYFQSWGAELEAAADQVRHLIGDAHWLSDGSHKEFLLRDLLSKYLPDRFWASNGFVRPSDHSYSCSPEVDILVVDSFLETPFLRTPGLIISPPSSIAAHIQVKSNLTQKSLRQALANQIATQFVISQHTTPKKVTWRGIFFSSDNSKKGAETLHKLMESELAKPARILNCIPKSAKIRPSQITASLMPNCIATFASSICFLNKGSVDTSIHGKFFDTKNSAACGLASLFASIRQACGAPPIKTGTELGAAFGVTAPYKNCDFPLTAGGRK